MHRNITFRTQGLCRINSNSRSSSRVANCTVTVVLVVVLEGIRMLVVAMLAKAVVVVEVSIVKKW